MPLTIVMYHYVRDLAHSRYPAIKGRTIGQFAAQLDYIDRHHSVVTAQEVVAAAQGRGTLPDNACWLTFDDGYIDHYTNVFPLLDARGWQGSFFMPAEPVIQGKLLDVNKIHFLLAGQPDVAVLIDALRIAVEGERAAGAQPLDWDAYLVEHRGDCHLDTSDVLFFKSMLQHGLPEAVRHRICDELFARFVGIDQAAFATELYLSIDQARTMVRHGMFFGSHGYAHHWLSSLDEDTQASEIDRSLDFLSMLGMPTADWVMCYPHGGYNGTTLDLLRARGCALALTTKPGDAQIGVGSPLELPRVDTIDLPLG